MTCIRVALAMLGLALASLSAPAASLVGEAPFQGTRDLNLIRTWDGSILEFLDFYPTRSLSMDEALAYYAPYGFRLANQNEVIELFNAFGFTYAFTPGTYTEITDMTSAERDWFIHVMTPTNISGQVGVRSMYENADGWAQTSYFCIGIICSPEAFTNDRHTDGVINTGKTLVRDAVVPLPAAASLLAGAIAALGLLGRRFRRPGVS